MQNQIFRKKSLDRVSSPDQLDDYIRVTPPSVWLVFAAIAVLLVGVCVWGALGYLETVTPVAAYSDPASGQLVLYIKEKDQPYVKEGTVFRINEQEYTVSSVSDDHYRMSEIPGGESDYALHVGGLVMGEWVTCAFAQQQEPLPEGIYSADVVLERIHPMNFILN